MEILTSAMAGLARLIPGPALRFFRRRRAEATAAQSPERYKNVSSLFEGLLRRLSSPQPDQAFARALADSAVNGVFVPDFLLTPNVQQWLAEPPVGQALSALAMSKLLSMQENSSLRALAVTRYQAVALANEQEADGVVSSLVAMLCASADAAIDDKGTATLITGLSQEMTRRFDALSDARHSVDSVAPPAFPVLIELDAPTFTIWKLSLEAASGALLKWPTTVGKGAHIDRSELEHLLDQIRTDERHIVALLGPPGAGKSALLAQLGRRLLEGDVAVLAIKADVLGADVANEEDLRRELNLPALPSTMLPQLALTTPVVLLVDQLDALAGHLDTKTGRLSVLLNLVRALSTIERVSIVVSCRAFEYTHDIRLSRINAESIDLQLPSWEKVLAVLEAHGVHAAGFNSDAREVLRVPQHLSTYLRLHESGITESISNYTAMLNSLWSTRVLSVPGAERLAALAFSIAEKMAEKEVLWVAASHFDEQVENLNKLRAAGILTLTDQGSLGFTHQTVFEHVLARSFSKSEGRLSAYVLTRTESLFVRPKLWAALSYLRGVEPETYESELIAIWNAPGLRKHLRFLVIEFIGSQAAPSGREATLLLKAAENAELRAIVLRAIRGSTGWFKRLRWGLIPDAMQAEHLADLCVPILVEAWPDAIDEVTNLLLQYWSSSTHASRFIYMLGEAPKWTDELVKAAKTAISGQDNTRYSGRLIDSVGAREPRVALDLLRHVLDEELARSVVKAEHLLAVAQKEKPKDGDPDIAWRMEYDARQPIAKLIDDRNNWDSLSGLSAAAPKEFLNILWPWYLNAFRSLAAFTTGDDPHLGYRMAYHVDFRFAGEDRNSLNPPNLLEALTTAVDELAKVSCEDLICWVTSQEEIALAPVQRLRAYAFAAMGQRAASQALAFLLADERRYFLGGVSDTFSTTRTMISVCAPHWSGDEVDRFISKARDFSPPRPPEFNSGDIKSWYRLIKRTRLTLLNALPEHIRPADVRRELEEADRANLKLSHVADHAPGWSGAIMRAGQFALASPADIANAFKEVPDSQAWDHATSFGRGGNVQLSREFAAFATNEPQRALQVIELLEPEFAQRAVGSAIEVLAEKLTPEELTRLITLQHQRGFSNSEFRRSCANALDKLVQKELRLSEPILELLEHWAEIEFESMPVREATVSRRDEEPEDDAKLGRFLLSGDTTMRVVPGGDYIVLSTLIRARSLRDEYPQVVRLLRNRLSKSRDRETWEFLMDWMAPLASSHVPGGAQLIGDVLSQVPLLGSPSAAILIARIHEHALEQVLPLLASWRVSADVQTQRGFGELVALIATVNKTPGPVTGWLDELLLSPSSVEARAGATAFAVHHMWSVREYQSTAADLLLRLLEKEEPAVWRELFKLFALVDSLNPDAHTLKLLRGIARRIDRAPPPAEPYLVERLGGLLPHDAELVVDIASKLLQLWSDRLSNHGSAVVSAGPEMVDLALTLHRTEGTKLQGLQMFEQLIEIDAYQARETLNELDHRVRSGARPPRPLLRRRARRRTASS